MVTCEELWSNTGNAGGTALACLPVTFQETGSLSLSFAGATLESKLRFYSNAYLIVICVLLSL